ncbi:holin [Streptomyces sp. SCA3-4]|uniref:holin n=1 Tax=Streptomyces sichuanensis TaxID=2871810 RepID=UPI001CE2C226|nr:holin [Streptomyces sichuanensis]MCA6093170.1 holin [Streptomyces sichuanensis]
MRKVLLDIAERTIAAYVTTFLGLLIADGFDLTSVSAIKAAAIAALPAALSVIKGAIGSRFGDKGTAAWLPARREGRGEGRSQGQGRR